MRFCPVCRKPRTEGSERCGNCRAPYPTGLANLEEIVGYGRGRIRARTRSLRTRPAAFAAIGIAVLAGGIGVASLFGARPPASGTGGGSPGPASSLAAQIPPGTATSPAAAPPSPTASASRPAPVQVQVSASVSQDPAATAVAAFVSRYFTAINEHRYHAFLVLHVPQLQQGLTRAGFNSGYRGTRDSSVQLAGLSTAADGDTEAVLTFTSHQRPDVANNEESCTAWDISLFLNNGSGRYLIDLPPPGYHAASAPCP